MQKFFIYIFFIMSSVYASNIFAIKEVCLAVNGSQTAMNFSSSNVSIEYNKPSSSSNSNSLNIDKACAYCKKKCSGTKPQPRTIVRSKKNPSKNFICYCSKNNKTREKKQPKVRANLAQIEKHLKQVCWEKKSMGELFSFYKDKHRYLQDLEIKFKIIRQSKSGLDIHAMMTHPSKELFLKLLKTASEQLTGLACPIAGIVCGEALKSAFAIMDSIKEGRQGKKFKNVTGTAKRATNFYVGIKKMKDDHKKMIADFLVARKGIDGSHNIAIIEGKKEIQNLEQLKSQFKGPQKQQVKKLIKKYAPCFYPFYSYD